MEKEELQALINAEEKLSVAALRLIRFAEGKKNSGFFLFRAKQKCFLIDQKLFALRPDLLLTGRTLVGKALFEKEGALKYLGGAPLRGAVFKEAEKIANGRANLEEGSLESSFQAASELVEKASLLKDALSKAAQQHGFVCLFHEKPFDGIEGLGIDLHLSWKIDDSKESLISEILRASFVRSLHRHGPLIWASIATAGNDLRFVAKEKIPSFSEVTSSEFVFSGVGSAEDLGLALTVLQAAIAESLHVILDDLERKKSTAILKKTFVEIAGWQKKCPEAYRAWLQPATELLFEGIFSRQKLQEIHDALMFRYNATVEKEARVLIDLFHTKILTACKRFSTITDELMSSINEMERICNQTKDLGWDAKAKVLSELVHPKMEAARELIDHLETIAPSWPLPKYRELLT